MSIKGLVLNNTVKTTETWTVNNRLACHCEVRAIVELHITVKQYLSVLSLSNKQKRRNTNQIKVLNSM